MKTQVRITKDDPEGEYLIGYTGYIDGYVYSERTNIFALVVCGIKIFPIPIDALSVQPHYPIISY